MVYSYKELKEKYGSDYQIKKKLSSKELHKIVGGVYSDKEIANPLSVVCKRYPKTIITMDSAFYFYNLTDVIPQNIHIATKMHSYVIPDKYINQYFINDELFDIGKTTCNINDEIINIYDKERLLIELIKRRNQIPFDYYKEIINNYRNISNELNIKRLEKYLSNFSLEDKIFDIIQKEVF